MKKLFLAGALALFGAMNAQTTKGSWVVEGKTSLGFNNVSTKVKAGDIKADSPEVSTFTIAPSVGYFVMDNLSVGLDFSLTSITAKEDGEKGTQTTVNILPNATYYFTTVSNLRPYLGAGVGYGSTTIESKTTDGFAWGVKGGAVYLLNNTIGLNLGLGFNQFSSKEDNVKVTASTLGVNAGITVFLK